MTAIRRSLTINKRGKAGGFCRCTLSACVGSQNASRSHQWRMRWKPKTLSLGEALITYQENQHFPALPGSRMLSREGIRRSIWKIGLAACGSLWWCRNEIEAELLYATLL